MSLGGGRPHGAPRQGGHASHGRGVHRIPSLVAGPEAHTHTLGKQASAIPRVSCTLVYMASHTLPRVFGSTLTEGIGYQVWMTSW